MGVALPVPGDVRGLPAGTQFQRDAVAAGEALIMAGDPAEAIGLVPDFEYPDIAEDGDESDTAARSVRDCPGRCIRYPARRRPRVSISASRSTPCAPRSALPLMRWARCTRKRQAGTSKTRAVSSNRSWNLNGDTAFRTMRRRVPLRVLENAAYIDAIITVSSGLIPIGLNSSADVQTASEALRPLTGVVRSARLAAVSAILQSAWQH